MKINNSHMHLINTDMVADKFLKTRIPFLKEWQLKTYTVKGLSYLMKWLPTKTLNRLPDLIDIFQMHINDIADLYIEEMKKAGIEKAIVLMMDMDQSSFGDTSELSYGYQIELISKICKKYENKLYPFVMFDPRRESADDIIKNSLTQHLYFITGVKMYPPLGYDPDYKSVYNTTKTNLKLQEIYWHCNRFNIPIISHCSKGGAYSHHTMRSKEERNWLAHPRRWERVLQDFPNLKVCLAHFGGDFHDMIITDEGVISYNNSCPYSYHIIHMMNKYKNLWTDIAYNDKLFNKNTTYRWVTNFWNLPNYVHKRMMFGTDWPMTAHTWAEKEYSSLTINSIAKNCPTYRYQTYNNIVDDVFRRNFCEFLGIEE